MAETSSCPSVGIDLLSRGTLMLEWLEYMFDTPSHKDVLRSPTVLRKAIFRYILFLHKRWLLRDDDKKRFALLPPPDVSWIWHGKVFFAPRSTYLCLLPLIFLRIRFGRAHDSHAPLSQRLKVKYFLLRRCQRGVEVQ